MRYEEIIDPFHRMLHRRLTENREQKAEALQNGAALRTENDTRTTAEKYLEQVAYLRAIDDVLDVCEEIERTQQGRKEDR